MDTSIPEYGTNAFVSSSKGHSDIFRNFHSFLGDFHNPMRTGLFGDNPAFSGLLEKAFPGFGEQYQDIHALLGRFTSMPGMEVISNLFQGNNK